VPIEIAPGKSNRDYLRTKRAKFGHLLSMLGEGQESGTAVRRPGKARTKS